MRVRFRVPQNYGTTVRAISKPADAFCPFFSPADPLFAPLRPRDPLGSHRRPLTPVRRRTVAPLNPRSCLPSAFEMGQGFVMIGAPARRAEMSVQLQTTIYLHPFS